MWTRPPPRPAVEGGEADDRGGSRRDGSGGDGGSGDCGSRGVLLAVAGEVAGGMAAGSRLFRVSFLSVDLLLGHARRLVARSCPSTGRPPTPVAPFSTLRASHHEQGILESLRDDDAARANSQRSALPMSPHTAHRRRRRGGVSPSSASHRPPRAPGGWGSRDDAAARRGPRRQQPPTGCSEHHAAPARCALASAYAAARGHAKQKARDPIPLVSPTSAVVAARAPQRRRRDKVGGGVCRGWRGPAGLWRHEIVTVHGSLQPPRLRR